MEIKISDGDARFCCATRVSQAGQRRFRGCATEHLQGALESRKTSCWVLGCYPSTRFLSRGRYAIRQTENVLTNPLILRGTGTCRRINIRRRSYGLRHLLPSEEGTFVEACGHETMEKVLRIIKPLLHLNVGCTSSSSHAPGAV